MSWGDRKTHQYWDQNGFLKHMTPIKQNNWFFEFIQSDNDTNVSIEPNLEGSGYVLLANYQSLNGRGLAEIGLKLDKIINYLENIKISNTGFVYLVDKKGTIKTNKNKRLLEKQMLSNLYDEKTSHALLNKKQPNLISKNNKIIASQYLPTMGWYLVVEISNDSIYGSDSSMNKMGKDILTLAIILTLLGGLTAYLIACAYDKNQI